MNAVGNRGQQKVLQGQEDTRQGAVRSPSVNRAVGSSLSGLTV